MNIPKILRATSVAAVAVVALAGCMKMDINLDLQSDDTVNGSMTVAVSQALVEMSGQDADSLVDQMQDDILSSDSDMGDVRVEAYSDDDGFVGSTSHFTGAALDTFDSGDADSISIVRDGDEFVVTGVMDMAGEDMQGMESMMSGMSIRVAITFPGAVSDHTGELEGNTVTWEPKIGERTDISARGSAVAGGAAGGLNVLLLAGLGVLALVVIVVIVLVVVRKNQAAAPAGAQEGQFAPGAATYPAEAAPQAYAPQPHASQPSAPQPPAGSVAAPDVPPVAPPVPPAPPADPPASPGPEQQNS